MSDPNPPEQPSFNQPAPGDPTAPMPTGGPATPPPGSPEDVPMPAVGSTPPPVGGGTQPPPPPPPAPPTGGPSGVSSIPDPAKEGAGFFNALFDFSFTNFVTPILVRIVYLLATAALVASWLVFLFAAFAQNVGSGITVLILGPVFLIIYLAVIRMTLEFYLSVVRMSMDIHQRLPQA
ncbi:DUF4282 domain-containing protein [Monashia sp. NPDC004114]